MLRRIAFLSCTVAQIALGQQGASASPSDTLPLVWPIAAPSAARVAAVRACDPGVIPPAPVAADSTAACLLARTVAAELRALARGAAPHDSTRRKALAMGKMEPLFLLYNTFFFSPLHGAIRYVAPPSVALQPITSLAITYSWRGLGTAVDWNASVAQSDTSVIVTLKRNSMPDSIVTISGALLRALGPAMTDFIPVAAPVTIQPCWDNTPDWKVTVTTRDGTALLLTTNQSNDYGFTGAWQLEVAGQKYLQISGDLVDAFREIVRAASLPLGRPMAGGCGAAKPVFPAAYPVSGGGG